MAVLLDIGAANRRFARRFRSNNKSRRLMFLCGEPRFAGSWDGHVRPGAIKCIKASYSDFAVPDGTLDFVTLNAFHPFTTVDGLSRELARTLKPGIGCFISAHPIGLHPELEDDGYFESLQFVRKNRPDESIQEIIFNQHRGWFPYAVSVFGLPNAEGELVYPSSSAIEDRLRVLALPEHLRQGGAQYIYGDLDPPPSIRVWQRTTKECMRSVPAVA